MVGRNQQEEAMKRLSIIAVALAVSGVIAANLWQLYTTHQQAQWLILQATAPNNVVTYQAGQNQMLYLMRCPACGAPVMPDKAEDVKVLPLQIGDAVLPLPGAEPNATCPRCGRVRMPFVGWAAWPQLLESPEPELETPAKE